MAEANVYCEECLEDIPNDEVYWDEDRLYCSRCGSEVEPPDGDIFDTIVENRSSFLFRDQEQNRDGDEEDNGKKSGRLGEDDEEDSASEEDDVEVVKGVDDVD